MEFANMLWDNTSAMEKTDNNGSENRTIKSWFQYVALQSEDLTLEEIVEIHKQMFRDDDLKTLTEVSEWINENATADEYGNAFVTNRDNSSGIITIIYPNKDAEDKILANEGLSFFDKDWEGGKIVNAQDHLQILMFIHTASKLSQENEIRNGWEITGNN